MDFQRKILAHLLVFISTGLFSNILVDAVEDKFRKDRQCLGECFVRYFEKMKGWCDNNVLWQSDPIQDYENALEAEVSTFLRMGKKVKDIKTFEATTKLYFTAIENAGVQFENDPDTKIKAMIDLCIEIKETCSSDYHPPSIPLIDHLKSLLEKSRESMSITMVKKIEDQFADGCLHEVTSEIGS